MGLFMGRVKTITPDDIRETRCLIFDEETGDITITVLAEGVVNITLKSDGDVLFNDVSISDKNVSDILMRAHQFQ